MTSEVDAPSSAPKGDEQNKPTNAVVAVEAEADKVGDSQGEQLEELISSLGEFDRFQGYVCFLAAIGSFIPAMIVVGMTFLAFEPPHRCYIESCDLEDGATAYNQTFLDFTTPYDEGKDRWEQCEAYYYNGTAMGSFLSSEGDNDTCSEEYFYHTQTQSCKAGHVYDDSMFQSSIITDYNLFCKSPWLISLPGMMYMIGMLFGAILLGNLADKIGRRNTLVVSCILLGVSGAVSAVSPNYALFLVARAVSGAGAVGMFQIIFVLAVEFIGAKYRTFVGIMIEAPFALGEAMTGVLAYFIRDWRYLQLALTVPALLIISYRWLMPESVRWLVSQNRIEEAIDTLKRVARANKKDLPDEKLAFLREASIAQQKNSEIASTSGSVSSETKKKSKSVLDLLRTPNMRARSLNMFFCWGAVTFMYYGLSLNAGNLGSNIFVSFILTMLIEIPSYLFSWFALDRMGRKGTLMFSFLLGGVSCIIAGCIDEDYETAKVAFSLIGKFGAAAAFAIVYVYASEIFPTDLRGVGIGACSMIARVGGLFAPLIVELFKSTPAVAPIIFGIFGIVCGFVVILLPETVGTSLPQTLEESESFGADQSKLDLCYCITVRKNRHRDEQAQ